MASASSVSNDQLLSDLEQRAADAERRLSVLESGPRASASPDVLQTLQTVKQLLLTAKERQTQLERREAELTKEAKQNKSALDVLKAKNSKLEYQILHLKRAVKDADATKAAPA